MAQDILIVDDESDIRRLIAETLEDEGYTTRHAAEGNAALEAVANRRPTLIILDIWLGDSRLDGIKILETVKVDHPDVPIIMMSGHGTIETAVNAIKKGAYDFIEKPFKMDHLLLVVKRALETARLRRENDELRQRSSIEKENSGYALIPSCVRQIIDRVAHTNSRVIIQGACGTGKEIVARMLHGMSFRKNGPFAVVNCLSRDGVSLEQELFGVEEAANHKVGALECAHQGTLFLDEVGQLSLDLQGRLVRFLHENSFSRLGGSRKVDVDVRVIGGSSCDLSKLVKDGTFREDLYYRLNVVPIHLPSLKDRLDEMPFLLDLFMEASLKTNGLAKKTFSEEAMLCLKAYSWPGNLRQLKNMVDWVLIMAEDRDAPEITVDMLPSEIGSQVPSILHSQQAAELMTLPLREARERFEKDYLLAQVSRFAGNISHTAHFVGMERSALHRKLKSLKIERSS